MKKFLIAMMMVQFLAMTNAPVALALDGTKTSGLLIAAISENPISDSTELTTAAVTTSGATSLPDLSPAPQTTGAGESAKSQAPDKNVADPSSAKVETTNAEAVKLETVKTDASTKTETTKAEETVKTDASTTAKTAKSADRSKTDAAKVETIKVEETVKTETKAGDAVKTETTKTETEKSSKTEATLPVEERKVSVTSDVTKAESTAVETQVIPADLQATVKTDAVETDKEKIASIAGTASGAEPIVIDNDEAVETEQSIKYEDLPTDEGKTKVKTGARFPVVISSQVTSKTSKKGDPVEARLKYDLKIGDRLVAKKGSVVNGHINYSLKARSMMHSMLSPERWYRNSGCVGISFDEIINEKGEHLPLVAAPARAARIVKNKAEGRVLGINHEGQVTGPWSQQLRYKAIRIGLNVAMAPAGVFSFGAMPAVLGVIGAVNPSFAFMKPVGQNVRHRRIKGFVWGALSGVPGSWIVEDTVIKGQEAVIKPGDEFLAEFQQEFTGEPASEASLIPGANAKVHGQVLPEKKKKGKSSS